MTQKIMCGSACVKYILEKKEKQNVELDANMIWIAQLATCLKANGIKDIKVCFYDSNLYRDYKKNNNHEFLGFQYLDDMLNTNIKCIQKKLTIEELESEIVQNEYIILCVESSKFNDDSMMTGGHFVILNGEINDKAIVVNPVKDNYEIIHISKNKLIDYCKDFGSWRILIKGGNND